MVSMHVRTCDTHSADTKQHNAAALLLLTRATAAVLSSTLIRLACWRLGLAHVRPHFTAGVGGCAGVAGAAGVLV
jgi:hypothetical protein